MPLPGVTKDLPSDFQLGAKLGAGQLQLQAQHARCGAEAGVMAESSAFQLAIVTHKGATRAASIELRCANPRS